MMSSVFAALASFFVAHTGDPQAQPVMVAVGARFPRDDARRLLDAANAERTASGRAALQQDAMLSRIAHEHAVEMARDNAVTHDSADGSSPWDRFDRAGIPFEFAGENVALGPDPDTAARSLWNSPEHRRNTLEPHFVRVGVAVVATPLGEYFVEDFAG